MIKINVVKAYLKKEFSELVRSRLIIMVYLMPSMILILFGYGIKMEVYNVRTAIINYDKSQLSYRIISAFEHSRYFTAEVVNLPEEKALEMMKRAEIDLLIIIPESFEKHLLKGIKTEIGIFVDASFPFRGLTIQSYAEGVLLKEAQEVLQSRPSIVINHRNLFNQAMRDENAIVPGLLGIVFLVAPAILSALLIVREKERGTIFNFYSSPVRKTDFVIGKLSLPFLLHSVNIFIIFLWAAYLFKVPFRGNFFIYWITSEIYVLISVSIGLLVSIVARTQIVAIVLTVIITIIPGFLYSGIVMPISSMEGEAAVEAHIFPVMYYNHIIYDTFLIGQGFSSDKNLFYFFILIFYWLFITVIGVLLLRKELR
ncbi:ABC transporter permease [Persephonella atlantica]|uniref:ABC transporter permease n=1 Tax=Persephonella atlantica TaxID=2699429 RepID=UPI001A9352D7|nr:ABC transporter permease [Persephonella atlantica]